MSRYHGNDITFAKELLTDRRRIADEAAAEWLAAPEHAALLDEMAAVRYETVSVHFAEDEAYARLQRAFSRRKTLRSIGHWSVAAAVVLLIGVAGHQLYKHKTPQTAPIAATIPQPQRQIELTLATGERVLLDTARHLITGARENGIRNNSLQGLDYRGAAVVGNAEAFNTLRIPVGGFYTLHLEDGTTVWLNALSALRYPVAFPGNARKVQLEGEAYFDVAHRDGQPFIVEANGVEVEVYGTEFNINAYAPDAVHTVLVEGAVGVHATASGKEVKLRPNQMATCSRNGSIQVTEVDPYKHTAWRNGEFVFEEETIEDILHRLSRWYDIEVFYANEEVKGKTFSGIINRFEDVQDVLRLIESVAVVRFELKGKTLLVKLIE